MNMGGVMLALLGFLTVAFMLFVIMTKRLSPLVALIIVPIVTGLIACAFISIGTDGKIIQGVDVNYLSNVKMLGKMISGEKGIGSVASTGVMFIFSILFFGVLTDAGTFRPIIKKIIDVVGQDPIKIAVGTAILTAIVHLDGSGAVTFLVCVPALLPLYDSIGMKRTTLATIAALSAGTMNVLPWGGPTIRASSALGENNVMNFFRPVLPAFFTGFVAVILISIFLGKKEKKELGFNNVKNNTEFNIELTEKEKMLEKPQLFWTNIVLIIFAILFLLFSGLPPAVVFMIFYVIATVLNYPNVEESKERVDDHAKSALMMCSVLFAAGCFTGVMQGTGMIKAMSDALISIIPHSLGKYFAIIVGIIGMPASLLFDPDSFYFGVLPVLSQTASEFGVAASNVGRAAILGQMSLGFPISPLTASTFLLVGLAGVELGDHQKKTIPLLWLVSLIMVLVAFLTGAI